jgi:hypothetical protein
MEESNKHLSNRAKMVRMLLLIIGVFLILIVMFSVCAEQNRSFYCLSEGKCVTVWKRYGDKCYIILDKYNGIFKPTDNYIKTTNTAFVDVIWTDDNRLLIDTDDNAEIIQPYSEKKLVIERYSKDKVINDSLYTYFDGKYNRYNEKVNYIRLYVKENYAADRANKKIK